jgi:Mce-associated membrane protein
VVIALTVVLVATPAAAQEDPATGPSNRALLDTERTSELLARAKDVSEQLFSYTYTDLDGHKTRFKELSTGTFSDKYDELFASVEQQAGVMQASLTSTVKDVAVRVLTDDRAEVLVFIDQNSTRGDTGATTTAGSMYLATFADVDGEWKVSDIDLFQGGK